MTETPHPNEPPARDSDRAEPTTLTHFDEAGSAHMVNVGGKPVTRRTAVAEAIVTADASTIATIETKEAAKGDVIGVARLAGIMGAKQTANLIPLCHPLPLNAATLDFEFRSDRELRIVATTEVDAKTGVEMEALAAVSVAALTVYDMVKAIDRGVVIGPIRLIEKRGGKSGDWKAD